MRLAIADPPYPPALSERRDLADGGVRVTSRSRAARWYRDHPDHAVWDDPAEHRALMESLLAEYDGWAIATSTDGLHAYLPLPIPCRLLVWHRPTAPPGGHRIRVTCEFVILYPPEPRRSRFAGDTVTDHLDSISARVGFTGAKPHAWTRWVLDALGYDPATDTVDDLFPGSGEVTRAIESAAAGPDWTQPPLLAPERG